MSHKDKHDKARRVDSRDWCVGYIEGHKVQLGRVKQDGSAGYVTKRWEAKDHAFPQGLMNTFNGPVQEGVDQIHKSQRSWEAVCESVLLALPKGASTARCTSTKTGTRRIAVLNYREEPAIEFLVVDCHHHKCSDFYQRAKDGEPFLNKWGHPKRSIQRLAQYLHDRHEKVKKLERKSKALFRIAIPVFRGGVVWLVPLRVRKHKTKHHSKKKHHHHHHHHDTHEREQSFNF